ncbi:MAG: hypothetical protein EOS70_30715 [Mesorhizobium sp.]|uniref:hypothetical protein n=1 Tax=Mesorhizobium sp. TaxID=1871066 RepID=UPI000FE86D59|nr:hypothetical protein [Mesorhizobium sp.]RWC26913.1 MAG: hypothetical protein EOS70_30715 [Mesorhizobium sp.]
MLHSPIVAGGGAEPSPIRLRVLSLGAGVQSTTLALMAAHGHFGSLDCAIFADTGWEPAAVYEHLRWLMSPNVLPFPVHIVSARNLRESLIDAGNGKRWASIPAFTRTVDRRGNISIGMIRRQCTTTSKIEPIRRKVRELAGLTRKRSPTYPVVHQWLGISMDEVVRMKPSRAAWQLNRFPLIESRMTRKDCLDWLKSHGYPKPPKSACIGCPFHSDAMWRSMRNNDRAAWDDAVEVDRAIRTGLRGIRGEVFLHRSGVPLDEADLSTAADHGQLDLWPNECEGMCGL